MPFKIIRQDITKLHTDAIVNTANPKPVVGRGTESRIYEVAGWDSLLKEREKYGDLEPGSAVATAAFDLPAKVVIHTVGRPWRGGSEGEEDVVRDCYRNSLKLAAKKECRSIAFPLLGTGAYGFPKTRALEIAEESFREWEDISPYDIKIILTVFDQDSYLLSEARYSRIEAYIDEHYVQETLDAEYTGPYEPTGDEVCEGAAAPVDDGEADVEMPSPISSHHLLLRGARRAFGKSKMKAESSAPMEELRFAGMAASKRDLKDVVAQAAETFQESLFRWIDERGMKDPEVYKKANLDKKLFSKIKKNKDYHPSKNTALALSIALRLNLDETKDLIGRAGYAFSPSEKFDLIIRFYIEEENYDIFEINEALYDFEQPLLGAI